MRWLDGIIDSMNMSLRKALEVSDGQGSLACCIPWKLQRVGHNLATEQQQQKPVRKLLNYKTKHAQDQKPPRLMLALTMKPLSQTCTPLSCITLSSTTTVLIPQTHQLKSKPNHLEDDSKNDRPEYWSG